MFAVVTFPMEATMKVLICLVTLGLLSGLIPAERASASGNFSRQTLLDLKPNDAVEGVIRAFDKYPIVALSEFHALEQEADFIGQLIRHPGFSNKVNEIVVEFGNALYQDVIDRYVEGKDVPLTELQQVWRNTTQLTIWDGAIYERFFANVRALNQTLPAKQRLHVLLGDPPIDWGKVERREEWQSFLDQRDEHFAGVVMKQVLAKKRKALLIIGGAHLNRWSEEIGANVAQLIEKKYPRSMFIIEPHIGFGKRNDELEPRLAAWSKPSLTNLKGNWLGELDASLIRVTIVQLPGKEPFNSYQGKKLGIIADAYLYLGPRDSLTASPRTPRDEDYVNEIKRRFKIMTGRELSPEAFTRVAPRKYLELLRLGVKQQQKDQVRVEDIEIRGYSLISRDAIFSHIKTRPGDQYDPEQIKRDFESVMQMKFFDPVKSNMVEKDGPRGGKILVFILTEK
jgi:surface antigen-like variable number repeat protein